MAYVYEHIRKDNGVVFYVGIGSDNSFKRAFITVGRNYLWNKIVNQTDYEIRIVERNISWEEACLIECDLISKYGRLDLDNGTLTNLTSGGEGFKQYHNETTKNKIKNTTSGKTYEQRYGEKKAAELIEKRRNDQKNIWLNRTESEKEAIRLKLSESFKGKKPKFTVIECPHCKKTGYEGNMKRWHFDNCKLLTTKK